MVHQQASKILPRRRPRTTKPWRSKNFGRFAQTSRKPPVPAPREAQQCLLRDPSWPSAFSVVNPCFLACLLACDEANAKRRTERLPGGAGSHDGWNSRRPGYVDTFGGWYQFPGRFDVPSCFNVPVRRRREISASSGVRSTPSPSWPAQAGHDGVAAMIPIG